MRSLHPPGLRPRERYASSRTHHCPAVSDRAGHYRRRFKAWNRTVYKLTKAGLVAALVAVLVLPTSLRT